MSKQHRFVALAFAGVSAWIAILAQAFYLLRSRPEAASPSENFTCMLNSRGLIRFVTPMECIFQRFGPIACVGIIFVAAFGYRYVRNRHS
jgi:hypothetical protein